MWQKFVIVVDMLVINWSKLGNLLQDLIDADHRWQILGHTTFLRERIADHATFVERLLYRRQRRTGSFGATFPVLGRTPDLFGCEIYRKSLGRFSTRSGWRLPCCPCRYGWVS